MKQWFNPIVMSLISAVLLTFHYFVAIVVLKLPPFRAPWAYSIAGALLMVALPIKLELDGETKWAYFGSIFTFLVSITLAIRVLSDLLSGAHPGVL